MKTSRIIGFMLLFLPVFVLGCALFDGPPTAGFVWVPAHPEPGQPVTFLDRSQDRDGAIVSCRWDFGDGSSTIKQNPTHPYSDSGSYRVRLSVKNSAGETDTAAATLTVGNRDSFYFVSNQGSDAHDGRTRRTAFRTMARALEVVQPGDTVLVQPGIYNEALTVGSAGSLDAPITVRGDGGTAVLDGEGVRGNRCLVRGLHQLHL